MRVGEWDRVGDGPSLAERNELCVAVRDAVDDDSRDGVRLDLGNDARVPLGNGESVRQPLAVWECVRVGLAARVVERGGLALRVGQRAGERECVSERVAVRLDLGFGLNVVYAVAVRVKPRHTEPLGLLVRIPVVDLFRVRDRVRAGLARDRVSVVVCRGDEHDDRLCLIERARKP